MNIGVAWKARTAEYALPQYKSSKPMKTNDFKGYSTLSKRWEYSRGRLLSRLQRRFGKDVVIGVQGS